ncbi:MAG: hypothetical protein GY754_02340 [bacterium]|nr:hypothetical protein [bacterium]
MNYEILIYIGGGYHLLFAVFDVFWPKIFNWKETLEPLDETNRALLKITNKLIIVLYSVFAYISFFHTGELLGSGLGNTLLASIAIYWFIRALMQPVYIGLKEKGSLPFFIAFLAGSAFYSVPLIVSL